MKFFEPSTTPPAPHTCHRQGATCVPVPGPEYLSFVRRTPQELPVGSPNPQCRMGPAMLEPCLGPFGELFPNRP